MRKVFSRGLCSHCYCKCLVIKGITCNMIIITIYLISCAILYQEKKNWTDNNYYRNWMRNRWTAIVAYTLNTKKKKKKKTPRTHSCYAQKILFFIMKFIYFAIPFMCCTRNQLKNDKHTCRTRINWSDLHTAKSLKIRRHVQNNETN